MRHLAGGCPFAVWRQTQRHQFYAPFPRNQDTRKRGLKLRVKDGTVVTCRWAGYDAPMGQTRSSQPFLAAEGKLFGSMDLGRRMRTARERATLSVEDVATGLRLTASAVRQWEAGQKFPTRDNLWEFAQLTSVDLAWLQTGIGTEDLDLLRKMAGRFAPVPLLDPSLAIGDWANGKRPESTSWVVPSWQCSDRAFAVEIFDSRNSPVYEKSDIVIIDPVAVPEPDDMVLARIFFRTRPVKPVFAKFAMRQHDPSAQVRSLLKGAKERIEKGIDVIQEALGPKEGKRVVAEIFEQAIAELKELPPAIDLVPLCTDWGTITIGPGSSSGAIVGVMTEHQHPRRTVSHK